MCLNFTTVYHAFFPNNLDFWVSRSACLPSGRPTLKGQPRILLRTRPTENLLGGKPVGSTQNLVHNLNQLANNVAVVSSVLLEGNPFIGYLLVTHEKKTEDLLFI
jgi:hypothetical protein